MVSEKIENAYAIVIKKKNFLNILFEYFHDFHPKKHIAKSNPTSPSNGKKPDIY